MAADSGFDELTREASNFGTSSEISAWAISGTGAVEEKEEEEEEAEKKALNIS